MNEKEDLYIVITSIGLLVLSLNLLHDYLKGDVINYGLFDKCGIIIGAALVFIGLILFKRNLSAKVKIHKILLMVILVAL